MDYIHQQLLSNDEAEEESRLAEAHAARKSRKHKRSHRKPRGNGLVVVVKANADLDSPAANDTSIPGLTSDSDEDGEVEVVSSSLAGVANDNLFEMDGVDEPATSGFRLDDEDEDDDDEDDVGGGKDAKIAAASHSIDASSSGSSSPVPG